MSSRFPPVRNDISIPRPRCPPTCFGSGYPCLIATFACPTLPPRERHTAEVHKQEATNASTGHGILRRCGATSSLDIRLFPTGSCRHRQGFVGCRSTRRERRSLESGADRKGPCRRQRWDWTVPNRRSETRHVYRDVHAVRIHDVQARGRRADGRWGDDDQCRPASGTGHRDDHRHRIDARRRYADKHETAGGAHQRRARRYPRDTNRTETSWPWCPASSR